MEKDLKLSKKIITTKESLTIYKKPLLICILVALGSVYSGGIILMLYSVNIFLEYVTLETATLLTNGLIFF